MSAANQKAVCGTCYKNPCECGLPQLPSELSPAPCSDESPWPLRDVVAKLVEASDLLLDHCNYDGHGWELISGARSEAKKWLRQNAKLSDGQQNRYDKT